ncbi:MAG: helix-turn-helix domain-containing protein, partial [Myxococcales bacterium]|nr:helix-turn-helix domain-containing protein [Myxococcales bacterium]
PTDLLNEHEAATFLGGVSIKTLQRWRWAGRGPAFVKIGALVRYERDVLERFIVDGRRTSTSQTGE